MGVFEEYINGLEGKENLDPTEVVSELLNLHNQEMSVANAAIATRDEAITNHTKTIADRDSEIQKQKSLNWDLANRIPAENDGVKEPEKTGELDPATITIDDLFEK